MAKLKFTAMVAEARNKLNGNVFSKNAYGNYIRNKVTPVNPQTSHQQNQRQMLGSLSAQWRGLSVSERQSWKDATGAFLRTDIFGDQQKLSPNVLFIALNKNLINAGKSTIDTAPSPEEIPSIGVSNFVANTSGPSLKFDINPGTIPSGYSLFVKATPNLSPGRSYVKNRLRFIGTETAASGTVKILSDWQNRFGSLVAGQRITVEVYLVNNTTGQAGVPVSITGIVS